MVPMQEAELPPWPPLHIEKRAGCCHDCPCHALAAKKSKKGRLDRLRKKILIYVLVMIILYLLGNVIALNTRVFAPQVDVHVTSNGTTSSSSTLSAEAQQCLSQYNVNAPSDPSGYPCSTCLPTLQAVPSNFSDGNAQDSQQILNAIQFCGLRSIFETSNGDGQAALKNGNWAQDVKFCAWTGVSCDGTGRVASMYVHIQVACEPVSNERSLRSLTFPGVPSSLPNELGALDGLQSLSVVGNSAVPGVYIMFGDRIHLLTIPLSAGSLPGSFTSWTSLNTLHLESTAMTSLPDNLLTVAPKLSTLTLVKNGQMGNNLPSSITSSSLQNLYVTVSTFLPS